MKKAAVLSARVGKLYRLHGNRSDNVMEGKMSRGATVLRLKKALADCWVCSAPNVDMK